MTARPPLSGSWCRRALGAGLAAVFVVAAACSGPRSGASAITDVSGCAAVLPLANQIVHGEGTLTTIRWISKRDADALSRKLGVPPPPPPQPQTRPQPRLPRVHHHLRSRWPKACLVVYRGNYPPGAIAGASPPALAGRYALLVLRIRHPSIERILVTDRFPPS
jgi:hypothetical protein